MNRGPKSGDCASALELFSISLDGELDPLQAYQLGRHLGACAPCRQTTTRLDALTSVLRAAPFEPAPEFVMPRRAWRRRLFQRGIPAAAALSVLALGLGLLHGSAEPRGGLIVPGTTVPVATEQAQVTYAIQPQPQQIYASASVAWTP